MANEKEPHYTTTVQAAKALETSTFSVQSWFDDGLLKGPLMPGGKRRPTVQSIREFARKYGYNMARFEELLKESLTKRPRRKKLQK